MVAIAQAKTTVKGATETTRTGASPVEAAGASSPELELNKTDLNSGKTPGANADVQGPKLSPSQARDAALEQVFGELQKSYTNNPVGLRMLGELKQYIQDNPATFDLTSRHGQALDSEAVTKRILGEYKDQLRKFIDKELPRKSGISPYESQQQDRNKKAYFGSQSSNLGVNSLKLPRVAEPEKIELTPSQAQTAALNRMFDELQREFLRNPEALKVVQDRMRDVVKNPQKYDFTSKDGVDLDSEAVIKRVGEYQIKLSSYIRAEFPNKQESGIRIKEQNSNQGLTRDEKTLLERRLERLLSPEAIKADREKQAYMGTSQEAFVGGSDWLKVETQRGTAQIEDFDPRERDPKDLLMRELMRSRGQEASMGSPKSSTVKDPEE